MEFEKQTNKKKAKKKLAIKSFLWTFLVATSLLVHSFVHNADRYIKRYDKHSTVSWIGSWIGKGRGKVNVLIPNTIIKYHLGDLNNKSSFSASSGCWSQRLGWQHAGLVMRTCFRASRWIPSHCVFVRLFLSLPHFIRSLISSWSPYLHDVL